MSTPFSNGKIMNNEHINELIHDHRWTEVLMGFGVGEYGLGDLSPSEMESLSSVAYRMNARGGERRYRVSIDYVNNKVLIKVYEYGEL